MVQPDLSALMLLVGIQKRNSACNNHVQLIYYGPTQNLA